MEDNRKRVGELKHGYHIAVIEKGTLGDISKIQEELDELKDARQQGVKIMELVELSDLIGAVEAYLAKNHPETTLTDLIAMSTVTHWRIRLILDPCANR
jgi:hypothetical protein